MSDDFYVGYIPRAPERFARFVRRVTVGLVITAAVVSVALVIAQQPFAGSSFHYGEYSAINGVLRELPYPVLSTAKADYVLVAPGKHGMSDAVRGFNGHEVNVRGSLIQRASDVMLEIEPGSLHDLRVADITAAEIDLGAIRATGEIVDSKCYYGVMNPGNGKVHRDCAARCIAGGIPPAFIARDANGNSKTFLLAGSDGRQLNREILDFVAEPVALEGRIVKSGQTLTLRTEPRTFHRISK